MTQLEFLRKQISSRLLPHAFLFSGPDIETKEEAISLLARHFLGGDYLASSDLVILSPLSHDKASPSISLSEVQQMRARAFRRPWTSADNASKNVFVIREIELLGRDAAPVLLKVLEDPPERSIFIATTNRVEGIPQTIRSRFSHIRFWKMPLEKTLVHVSRYRNMSFAKRFIKVPYIIQQNELAVFMREALINTEMQFRAMVKNGESLYDYADKFERMLDAYGLLQDPTVNKRLLGEYVMMLL